MRRKGILKRCRIARVSRSSDSTDIQRHIKKTNTFKGFSLKPKYQKTVSRLYADATLNNVCYYCGASASTVDHIPALKVADALGFVYLRSIGAPFIKVMCCTDCNSSLSGSMLVTENQRRDYLTIKLTKKLKHLQAVWTDDELAELGAALQDMILQRQLEAAILSTRLEHVHKRRK